MKEALRRAKALFARQTAATIQMQRLVRAHLARQQFRAMRAFHALMLRQGKAALFMQSSIRRFLATMEARKRRYDDAPVLLRHRVGLASRYSRCVFPVPSRFPSLSWQKRIKQRWEAAIKIQRTFRGSRGRHIFAILLSLNALRRVEEKAAVVIQTKYRTYRARFMLWMIREAQRKQEELEAHARVIQKAFRGLKGRQFAEIALNLRAVREISAPLQNEVRELEELEVKVRGSCGKRPGGGCLLLLRQAQQRGGLVTCLTLLWMLLLMLSPGEPQVRNDAEAAAGTGSQHQRVDGGSSAAGEVDAKVLRLGQVDGHHAAL